jgi:5-methylcytosine-specific restriction endonuclease McrA
MSKKYRNNKTSIKKIAEYWIKNNNIPEENLNFDWADSFTHCWNCGDNKKSSDGKTVRLERCHIIPHSLNGEDTPSNFVLLCNLCHTLAPNTSNKNDMWDWIKSNHIPFALTNTYRIRKALVLFKNKEGYSFFSKAIHIDNLLEKLENKMRNDMTTHGINYNESTYYYILKSLINENISL